MNTLYFHFCIVLKDLKHWRLLQSLPSALSIPWFDKQWKWVSAVHQFEAAVIG